jgi:beta-lactam-binding protein with PASTA domain
MRKLAAAAILLAFLSVALSAAAIWRSRNISHQPDSASALVAVPDTTNLNLYKAGSDLEALQLTFVVKPTPSIEVPKNRVMSQDPAPGTSVAAGTQIELTVSAGPP